MRKSVLFVCFLLLNIHLWGQGNFQEREIEVSSFLKGTLTSPDNTSVNTLIVFVQGSGATDRDGNQPTMKNDGIKKIARALADSNAAASFRYDKRIFRLNETGQTENDLRFDHFVEDLDSIISFFRRKGNYQKIILAGHSQGSLVSMISAKKSNVDGLISLAGPAKSIDTMIVEQVSKQVPQMGEMLRNNYNTLRETGKVEDVDPVLANFLRSSVQPFMLSWMRYSPVEEIRKLEIPILIIGGTGDIQVTGEEAKRLHEAKPDSKLVILEDMNHIFRKVASKDLLVNTKTYNEPLRPLHPELIPEILAFIKEIQ